MNPFSPLTQTKSKRKSPNDMANEVAAEEEEEEEENKTEQLLKMGFSRESVDQALKITGGNSIAEAATWIITSTHPHSSSSFSSSSSSIPSLQPNLHRFFPFTPTYSSPSLINPSSSPSPKPQTHRLPPLSERMRPTNLNQVLGQDHLLSSPNSLLHSSLLHNLLPSLILWGPPGTGKTSLAKALSSSSSSSSYLFISISAVSSGVKDIKQVAETARKTMSTSGRRTILFVDELHRFNKSQQDLFLPLIEQGTLVFVGATTENPSFHLAAPLLSRCTLLLLKPLLPIHISTILRSAESDQQRGLPLSVGTSVSVSEEAISFLSSNCDGDARVALNALETAAITALRAGGGAVGAGEGEKQVVEVTVRDAEEAMQCKHVLYDREGDQHYNLISALHKSMRGGDENAAIYWLARMIEGGEEPLYIARRLVRFASEDVGMADPGALSQAVACYQACHFMGMPECDVVLAQCVVYLAMAPKSIAVYRAIGEARKMVCESVGQNEGVPLHLRNAPTKLMKEVGYGEGYVYPPDNPSSSQEYLPPSLKGFKFLHWNHPTG